jgi:hypothetical protein
MALFQIFITGSANPIKPFSALMTALDYLPKLRYFPAKYWQRNQ